MPSWAYTIVAQPCEPTQNFHNQYRPRIPRQRLVNNSVPGCNNWRLCAKQWQCSSRFAMCPSYSARHSELRLIRPWQAVHHSLDDPFTNSSMINTVRVQGLLRFLPGHRYVITYCDDRVSVLRSISTGHCPYGPSFNNHISNLN